MYNNGVAPEIGANAYLELGFQHDKECVKKDLEKVMEEAKKAIEDGIDILAPDCGFGPKTPLANMKAMVEVAKKYGMKGRLARGG